MRKLTRKKLELNKKNLSNLKTNIENYIVPLENVKWIVIDGYSLEKFIELNYSNGNRKVSWHENFPELFKELERTYYEVLPLGMHYLTFTPPHFRKYLIGIVPNRVDKYTIIGAISYDDNQDIYYDRETVICIETVEINYFYQGQGLLGRMMDQFVQRIDLSKRILLTRESKEGKKHGVLKHLKDSLNKVGYQGDVRFEHEIDDEYLNSLRKIRNTK